jgi:hypothetical protein
MSAVGFKSTYVHCQNSDCERDFPAFAVGLERTRGFKARCWSCGHIGWYTTTDFQQSVSLGSVQSGRR